MQFTVMPRGTSFPPPPPQPKAPLARLGKRWRGQTRPGTWEVTRAVTADGEWLFELHEDGWRTGHLPTRTEVKDGLRSLQACRRYAGSGKALEDLKKIQAALREDD
jgi:hypothetical protein